MLEGIIVDHWGSKGIGAVDLDGASREGFDGRYRDPGTADKGSLMH